MSTKNHDFVDVHGIINEPKYPNCVQWADDGTWPLPLATRSPSSIPATCPALVHLQPRRPVRLQRHQCRRTAPRNADLVSYELTNTRAMAMNASYVNVTPMAQARSVAWSPAGSSDTGSCLLAVNTVDHRVWLEKGTRPLKHLPAASSCA